MISKTRRATLSASLLAVGLALSGAVNAAFISGIWQGDANYDQQGRFSDCTMTAQASSGLLIGFVISKRFDWGLVVADERRKFPLGSSEDVMLHIDKREPIQSIAKVVDVHGIVIPLENSAAVLEGLREGKALTVVGRTMKISFKLTGTRAAIAELAACVSENLVSERAEAGAPAPVRGARAQRRENSFSISASLSSI
jgi:hypothetical protein